MHMMNLMKQYMNGNVNKMNRDTEPIRIDEMGIEVCILCDCAVENNTCLCDMRGW